MGWCAACDYDGGSGVEVGHASGSVYLLYYREGGDVLAGLAVGFDVVDGDHGEVFADACEGACDGVG